MDTMTEKSYKITIVISILMLCWSLIMYAKKTNEHDRQQTTINTLNKRVDSLYKINDSLHWELLPVEIELGRYQVAYGIFLERNPKAASQFGDIISNETE